MLLYVDRPNDPHGCNHDDGENETQTVIVPLKFLPNPLSSMNGSIFQ